MPTSSWACPGPQACSAGHAHEDVGMPPAKDEMRIEPTIKNRGSSMSLQMNNNRCRRITIADAMLLVMGTAIGIAWTRYWLLLEQDSYEAGLDRLTGFARNMRLARWWAEALSCCILSLSVTWMVVRLRKPRLSIRRLSRQPGFVSTTAALTAFAVDSFFDITAWMTGLIQVFDAPRWSLAWWGDVWEDMILSLCLRTLCAAVVVAWLLLAISGRWRREPGWIDGIGTALGFYWLLVPPLLSVSYPEWMIS